MINASPLPLVINHDLKDRNEARRYRKGEYPDETNSCVCCGKKAGERWIAWDLATDLVMDVAWTNAEHAKGGADDVSFFPIGPTCAKKNKLPKGHLIKRADLFG